MNGPVNNSQLQVELRAYLPGLGGTARSSVWGLTVSLVLPSLGGGPLLQDWAGPKLNPSAKSAPLRPDSGAN